MHLPTRFPLQNPLQAPLQHINCLTTSISWRFQSSELLGLAPSLPNRRKVQCHGLMLFGHLLPAPTAGYRRLGTANRYLNTTAHLVPALCWQPLWACAAEMENTAANVVNKWERAHRRFPPRFPAVWLTYHNKSIHIK